jgi:hypothetical protein
LDWRAVAQPPPWDVGCMRKVRLIAPQDFYRPLCLTGVEGGADFCHPGFVVAVLGALRGTGLAKR